MHAAARAEKGEAMTKFDVTLVHTEKVTVEAATRDEAVRKAEAETAGETFAPDRVTVKEAKD